MTPQHRDRLLNLAQRIEARPEPLGIGLKHQCWAGLAHAAAAAHGARVTDYFGISFREMKDAIKENNQADASRRNEGMAARTRQFAASRC